MGWAGFTREMMGATVAVGATRSIMQNIHDKKRYRRRKRKYYRKRW